MTSTQSMSVPDAGAEFFGLGRDASYEATKPGTGPDGKPLIPAIRIGRRLRVYRPVMERRALEVAEQSPAA